MKSKLLSTFSGWMLLAMMATPVALRAQFSFTTNNGAITITGYTGTNGTLVIPSTTNGYPVVSIGNNAFENNNLIEATIPQGVDTIGDAAFWGCANLVSVTIPNTMTSIGGGAFYSCYNLTNITIPSGVTNIGNLAFSFCTSLAIFNIPNSVNNIGAYTFASDINLTSVTIADSITNIGEQAFDSCTSLTNVVIPKSVVNIEDSAFYNCDELASVYFEGDAPTVDSSVFGIYDSVNSATTAYYLPATQGWDVFNASSGLGPAVLWNPQVRIGHGSFGAQKNQFSFNITGTTNIPIVVEASLDLSRPAWTQLFNGMVTNGNVYFSDPQWTNYTGRFYRVRSP